MSFLNPVNKSYCLQTICESNYHKLLRLVPNLPSVNQLAVAYVDGKPSLYLNMIEKNPYTLTLELSHYFRENRESSFEPALKIRVYLDTQSVEVLCDHSRPFIRNAFHKNSSARDVLDYKWSLNYFLEKWLDHCLRYGYRFIAGNNSYYACAALD